MVSFPGKPPNILVTGTPGTGKTTTCELIAEATSLRYINVGDWVQKASLHSGWDTEHESFVIDEDKVNTPVFGAEETHRPKSQPVACKRLWVWHL